MALRIQCTSAEPMSASAELKRCTVLAPRRPPTDQRPNFLIVLRSLQPPSQTLPPLQDGAERKAVIRSLQPPTQPLTPLQDRAERTAVIRLRRLHLQPTLSSIAQAMEICPKHLPASRLGSRALG